VLVVERNGPRVSHSGDRRSRSAVRRSLALCLSEALDPTGIFPTGRKIGRIGRIGGIAAAEQAADEERRTK
jgi:hypothetical protein